MSDLNMIDAYVFDEGVTCSLSDPGLSMTEDGAKSFHNLGECSKLLRRPTQ